jgi:hypothetical protein
LPNGAPFSSTAPACFSIQAFHAAMPSRSRTLRWSSGNASHPLAARASGVPVKIAR